MANIRRKFAFRILQCGENTNAKSKHDDCICVKHSWGEAQKTLRALNEGVDRGLAYIKFEMIPSM